MGLEKFDPNKINFDGFFQDGGSIDYYTGDIFQKGYGMRGDGMGSIFRKFSKGFKFLLKTFGEHALPAAKEVGKVVGDEAIDTTAAILHNIVQGEKLKETVKSEGKKGMKRLAARLTNQSGGAAKRRKVVKPKKKMTIRRVVKRKPKKRSLHLLNTRLGFY